MARVLLYNLTEESRRKKVKAALFRCGIPSREVLPEEQGMRIGELLGLQDGAWEKAELSETEPFREEMIVMHELTTGQFHGFLDGLRAQGIRIPLKAMTTETNIGWTAGQLRNELTAEAEAIASGTGRPAHSQK